MPSNGNYNIALTVHAYKKIVSDWIGLANDCYILHAHSLHSQLSFFCSKSPFKNVNESDGDIQFEPKQAIVPSMIVEKQKASSTGIVALEHSSKSSRRSSI